MINMKIDFFGPALIKTYAYIFLFQDQTERFTDLHCKINRLPFGWPHIRLNSKHQHCCQKVLNPGSSAFLRLSDWQLWDSDRQQQNKCEICRLTLWLIRPQCSGSGLMQRNTHTHTTDSKCIDRHGNFHLTQAQQSVSIVAVSVCFVPNEINTDDDKTNTSVPGLSGWKRQSCHIF